MAESYLISPVKGLSMMTRNFLVTTGESYSADQVLIQLARVSDHFNNATNVDRGETSEFLRSAAHVIYGYYATPDIVSACVKICGLLLIKDPQFEYQKKRVILQEFATAPDLIAMTSLAMAFASTMLNPKPMDRVLATLSALLGRKLAASEVPTVFVEALDYIVGTLEYFAFLPGEIKRSGEDFLPNVFLSELETRMTYYLPH